ncbi:hypothetical protein [Sphingomonas colocasiae]|uniref:Uncharacterized protein n=1 Tax=Sphingomonas colocasiae TaxID=1848973 RepID=A0ABS7PWG3_9SPHN|nr:hypothetical protein [Sphingomonas colocasiae]MBY8824985.1 hypothetical protein [Sphingomonas colocasiae]
MKIRNMLQGTAFAIFATTLCATAAHAHKLRVKGETVTVADSTLAVTPSRDWNRLDIKPGKNSETWTLDGEQLNDVTFFAGIESGKPLVREANAKRDPLPKFKSNMLLIEIPELLEGTYRTYKKIGAFQLLSTEPGSAFGHDGVQFTYEYTDADELTRKGEARASIIKGKLYMITFDAPRLHYFDSTLTDFRTLADTAKLQ